MKLFDVEGDPQEGLQDAGNDDTPVFDNTAIAKFGAYEGFKF